jgi:hypothetical protein
MVATGQQGKTHVQRQLLYTATDMMDGQVFAKKTVIARRHLTAGQV